MSVPTLENLLAAQFRFSEPLSFPTFAVGDFCENDGAEQEPFDSHLPVFWPMLLRKKSLHFSGTTAFLSPCFESILSDCKYAAQSNSYFCAIHYVI